MDKMKAEILIYLFLQMELVPLKGTKVVKSHMASAT